MSDAKLQLLLDRDEISDVLHRYAKAIDTKNWTLLETCFTEDLEADFRSFAGKELGRGCAQWLEAIRTTIEGMDATQHLTGNHAHEIRGDQATLTADVQAAHWLRNERGDPEYTVGGYYECDLARTAEGWRIRKYKLTVNWSRGNRDILRLAAKRRQP
jgi:3-phenylpropionate/cinnamic acid dioxygenase small subunit